MIRRDYLVRMVQELTQALVRIVYLKQALEYPRALQEIERALARFWNLTPEQIKTFSVEQWIEQCRQEEGPMGEKLLALADVFKEQDELYAAQQNLPESQRSAAISLGLCLEAVVSPGIMISLDLLNKIEQLIERNQGSRLPTGVLKRLFAYFETRGMLDKAEDVLFDWLASGDAAAPAGGLAFYERLAGKSDQELARGGLPRDEVEDGREEWARVAGSHQ